MNSARPKRYSFNCCLDDVDVLVLLVLIPASASPYSILIEDSAILEETTSMKKEMFHHRIEVISQKSYVLIRKTLQSKEASGHKAHRYSPTCQWEMIHLPVSIFPHLCRPVTIFYHCTLKCICLCNEGFIRVHYNLTNNGHEHVDGLFDHILHWRPQSPEELLLFSFTLHITLIHMYHCVLSATTSIHIRCCPFIDKCKCYFSHKL